MQPGFDPNYNPAGNTQYNQPMPNQYNPSMGMQPMMQPGMIIQQPAGSSAGKIVMIVGIVIGILIIGSIILSGILYVWASNLATENQTEVGTFNSYNVEDASSGVTSGTDDNLVRLSFLTGEDDLKWSFLTITLYHGDITYTCDNNPTSDCFADESNADAAWNGNEVLVLQENGVNICDGNASTCDVKVTVSYKGRSVAGDGNTITIT